MRKAKREPEDFQAEADKYAHCRTCKAFTDFEKWQMAATERGYSVKLVTKSKNNDYSQARSEGTIVGFFNTDLKQGSLDSVFVTAAVVHAKVLNAFLLTGLDKKC